MTITLTHSTIRLPDFTKTITTLSCSYKPNKPQNHQQRQQQLPARDRVIDFGKHKGRMLGSLPSKYLKWVSKTLRAGDTEHWARLADQVLQDPVYNDRLEWEFADSVLNGTKNNNKVNINNVGDESAVSKLEEISERFGWDNDDKLGWSMVDFDLLGTSKSGRIPRMPLSNEDKRMGENYTIRGVVKEKKAVLSESDERRRERRERLRLKKDKVNGRGGAGRSIDGRGRGSFDNSVGVVDDGVCDQGMVNSDKKVSADRTVEIYNPFPGRESLLKKVFDRKRRI